MLHTGSTDQRRALLYVAARFMMVRIDLCAKRKRSRAQGLKGSNSTSIARDCNHCGTIGDAAVGVASRGRRNSVVELLDAG